MKNKIKFVANVQMNMLGIINIKPWLIKKFTITYNEWFIYKYKIWIYLVGTYIIKKIECIKITITDY